MSALEDLLALQLKGIAYTYGPAVLGDFAREFRFHPKRKFRSDFAWPGKMLLVEVEGGVWTGGRHTRGAGFEKDCEKYNAAAILGFKVLRFTQKSIKSGEAVQTIKQALEV